MATLYTHYDRNTRKTWVILVVFFALVVSVGWFASYYYGNPSLLVIAVFISVITNVFSYWNSDTLALKISGARPASRQEFFDLYNVTENLSITAGLPMPKLYVIEESVLNAFATGRNPAHATVAVTTGLLALLERSELEGVVAHELSHIGNRDTLVSTVTVILVGLIALISDIFLRMSWYRDRDSKAGGIVVIAGIVLVVISPVIASLMQLAISRKREFLADASGALLTRFPEGLASALEKISGHSGEMQRASHATAHLYISNPFGANAKGFINKLYSTHPPINERIAALLNQ
ncbi:MAG: M48 family metallopeptidase [bacterium]|nr:M48 family metallopeptidase [bacterium]